MEHNKNKHEMILSSEWFSVGREDLLWELFLEKEEGEWF